MHIHRAEADRETSSPTAGQKMVGAGLKASLDKSWRALTSLAEDIVILGQFAFGREYVRRPVA